MKFSRELNWVMWSTSQVTLRMGVSHCKSAPCLVWWCSWAFYTWIYNVFKLSSDLTIPRHWDGMQIYAQIFVLSHYTDRFYDQKHFDSGDIIILFSPKFKGGNLLCFVTMVISLVAISIWWWRYNVFNFSHDLPWKHV